MEDLVLKKYTEIDKPNDANNENTLIMSNLPDERQEKYKYVKVNNKYYKWGGTSIFQGNKNLVSFFEFEYFSGVGSMPLEGMDDIYTPDNMFKDCTALEDIALSFNFKYTANNMFEGCTSLKHIYGNSVKDGNGNPIKDENGKIDYQELGIEDVGANFAKNCKQLTVCNLSSNVKHIGNDAFNGCMSLTTFDMPANSNLVIDYTTSSTPFTGCYNINFTGSSYDGTSDIKVRVKDNACYEIIDDNTVRLIHMGKDSLVSNIPTDKTVYASAYSMEYRKESDVVVPANVIFDGNYIFYYSSGNSIKLNNIIGDSNCQSLFANTDYNGNYTFAQGETTIPQRCFYNSRNIVKITIPEGILKLDKSAFYNSSSLEEIILPTTIQTIESQVFWLTSLKSLTFKGNMPPTLYDDLFYGNMPDAIYVYPEHYENYKNNILPLFAPFVTPIRLYNEGYVRIIKDGQYLINDDDNVVTVGGLVVTQEEDFYMKYTSDENVLNINVYLNDSIIGQISGEYTTIYLGDNSSLFLGNGYNFRYGINNSEMEEMFTQKGWFYDARFEGVRSNPNIGEKIETEMEFIYLNNNIPITHGLYSQLSSNQTFGYSYFKKSDNSIIKNTTLGYNMKSDIQTTDGKIKIGYYGDKTKTGINGLVLHEIGNSVYSDPIINPVSTFLIGGESTFKNITVELIASDNIPDNAVYVTLTDNRKYVYRKLWNNEPIIFSVPNNVEYYVSASNFVTENGKEFFIDNENPVNTDNIVLNYKTKSGIELNGDMLSVYTEQTDWYLNIKQYSGVWGDYDVPSVMTDEILLSEANGFNNTKIISEIAPNSIFSKAYEFNFDEGIVGYIPSYLEIEIFSQYLFDVNKYLSNVGKPQITLDNLWVSESYDSDNAWNSDGVIVNKNNVLNYYIFGKKINF